MIYMATEQNSYNALQERMVNCMGEMEIIEIEYSEKTIDSGNIWADLAINIGVTAVGVLIGNAICFGASKLIESIKRKKTTTEKLVETTDTEGKTSVNTAEIQKNNN